jgi:signal-transduction protein with cAMP-binding, CBS, and nucleotidyltransferase domain
MLEFFEYLNSIHPLSAEATTALMKVIKVKELRKGQVWLQEGAVCDKLTFVVKGLMKMYFEDGCRELIMMLARENDRILAFESFLDASPSDFIIRSIEATLVIYVMRNDLFEVVKKMPELQVHYLKMVCEQCRLLEERSRLLLLPPYIRFKIVMRTDSWLSDGTRIYDRLLAGYLGVHPNAVCGWRRSKSELNG